MVGDGMVGDGMVGDGMRAPEVVVVGSGPNGLAAAVTLARAGVAVRVLEAADEPGGACRTSDLTLPGFRHDPCAAVHPMLAVSPFFAGPAFAGLHGALLQPEIPFAHPLDGGRAGVVHRSLETTAARLGSDGPAYRRLVGPPAAQAHRLAATVLAPLRSLPRDPLPVARFGRFGLVSAVALLRRLATPEARALLAGAAAHAVLPLDAPLSGGYGLLLTATAHAVGWPVVAGGSGGITRALVAELERYGGAVETGRRVGSLAELPSDRAVVLDTTPAALVALAGERMPARSRAPYRRFRHGPGVCKVDWALDGAVPWTAEPCRRATTLHVGGTAEEVIGAEAEVHAGRHPDRPFCIVVQPGAVDPGRAPAGRSTLWAYCHVPAGSTVDMADAIERQIERFAPGFGDLVLARSVRTAADAERANPNLVGGDIGGGAPTLWQTVFRPTVRWNPYRTPVDGVYLCSSSTPPGAGVHGMCGVYAARTVLHDRFGAGPPLRPAP